jgi:glycosyltransferase involved in cell wall biosynthesis
VTGYVSETELAAWYRRARILAFPSLDEGFGIPALEAMAAGVAVIASSRGALPEVCGGAAWLVDPTETDELRSALLALSNSEALRQNYVERGLARSASFTWNLAVKRTWEVYRSLV